jgi:hypothetical protein
MAFWYVRKHQKVFIWLGNAHVIFCWKQDTIAIDRGITIGPGSCELIYKVPIRENITENGMSSSRFHRMVFVGNSLLRQSRWEVDPWFSPRFRSSLHSPRFLGNQYAPNLLDKKKIYEGKALPWMFVRWIRNRFFHCWDIDGVFMMWLSCWRYPLVRRFRKGDNSRMADDRSQSIFPRTDLSASRPI